MSQSSTQQSVDRIFDLLEQDAAAVWEDIEATPQSTTAELWKRKLTKIAEKYTYSSRFALMRILCSRANGDSITEEGCASDSDFEICVHGRHYVFKDISMSHAEALTADEHLQYLLCLLDIADLQTDSDPAVNKHFISRAWFDEDSANLVSESLLPQDVLSDEMQRKKACLAYRKENRKYKACLTKEEAFRLGHILDFSLPEMQWFLLRTFDIAEGFRFNQSNDLIEAYGFLTGASWQHVQSIKNRYSAVRTSMENECGVPAIRGCTKDISDSLLGEIETWKLHPDSMDTQFLNWMQMQAAALDLPSRTAGRVYRNLAAFAYDLMTDIEIVPNENEFLDCFQDVSEEPGESGSVRRIFYQDGVLSAKRCKEIADALLLENKIQSVSIQEDNAKAWHVLSAQQDGTLTASGGAVNSQRTRVAEILFGAVQVEKSDMLYLLWFTANLIWQNHDVPDTNALCCRVFDFMDAAECILKEALLPEFYPPHPVEQSMLLSIVSGRSEDDAPSVVYEYMMRSLIKQRRRKQGSRKHDRAFKTEVVTHYRNHPELTLNECARLFEISPKTLSAWQKELLDTGKL